MHHIVKMLVTLGNIKKLFFICWNWSKFCQLKTLSTDSYQYVHNVFLYFCSLVGMSRSASVVAAYLMYKEKISLEDALAKIREKRSYVRYCTACSILLFNLCQKKIFFFAWPIIKITVFSSHTVRFKIFRAKFISVCPVISTSFLAPKHEASLSALSTKIYHHVICESDCVVSV